MKSSRSLLPKVMKTASLTLVLANSATRAGKGEPRSKISACSRALAINSACVINSCEQDSTTIGLISFICETFRAGCLPGPSPEIWLNFGFDVGEFNRQPEANYVAGNSESLGIADRGDQRISSGINRPRSAAECTELHKELSRSCQPRPEGLATLFNFGGYIRRAQKSCTRSGILQFSQFALE